MPRSAVAEVDAGWPWPTLPVNLAGAFALGFVVMYGRRRWSAALMAGVTVGVLGALTTFSALTAELWEMVDGGAWDSLASYATASVGGGWLAAVGGLRLGRARP